MSGMSKAIQRLAGDADAPSPIHPRVFRREGVSALAMRECPVFGGRRRHSSQTSLFPRIANVVRLRSEKEMVRVHAGRIVAAMANEEAIGNSSDVYDIRITMREPAFAVDRHHAVSKRVHSTSPDPAAIGLLKSRPELCLDSLRRRLVVTDSKANRLALHVAIHSRRPRCDASRKATTALAKFESLCHGEKYNKKHKNSIMSVDR